MTAMPVPALSDPGDGRRGAQRTRSAGRGGFKDFILKLQLLPPPYGFGDDWPGCPGWGEVFDDVGGEELLKCRDAVEFVAGSPVGSAGTPKLVPIPANGQENVAVRVDPAPVHE